MRKHYISNFKNLSRIFSEQWFKDNKNENHIIFKINKRLTNKSTRFMIENINYLWNADKLIGCLLKNNFLSRDIKNKLKNPPQFEDTLSEIKVVCHLLHNNIRNIKLNKTFPDIEISPNIIIEVKNLHTSQKLVDSKNKAEFIDDIERIKSRIKEEVLPKLTNNKINLILFEVPIGVDFDEFEDLFIFSEKRKYDLKAKQIIPLFEGWFSEEESKNISAVIMLKNNTYKGIINPLNKKIIPLNLKKVFNLREINFPNQNF